MLNNKIDMMCHFKAIISCLQLSDLKSSGQVCVNLINYFCYLYLKRL